MKNTIVLMMRTLFELLKSLMKDHKLKAAGLAILLDVSKGLVSDMLNYKKGFSKDTIRILSDRFKTEAGSI